MKLKALLAVTAALSFGGAFAQANFSDVPAGHWAKDAVDKMAAKGCIIGFPDGTYRGNESLTRYQAALILARCLQDPVVTGGLSVEDVESLKNAVQELSSELAALGVRIADVEDNAATKDDVAALEERIAALEGEDKGETVVGVDEDALAELAAAIDDLTAADEETAARIDDLVGALDELTAQLDDLAAAQDDLAARVEALEGEEPVEGEVYDDTELRGFIEDLTNAQGELGAGLDDLGGRVDELAATLDDLSAGLDDLNARVDELAATQDELVAANEETAAVLEEINGRIEELAASIDDVNLRVDELEGGLGDVTTTVEGLTEQVESNAASIVALQDLTVLLNEDIVGLEDRISALESDKADAEDVDARFTNLNRDLTDLTNRVTVVETNLSDLQGKFNTLNSQFGFSVSGTLSSNYYVSRVTGQNFDIDRIIPGTKFSSGVDDKGDDVTKDRPIDWADFGDFGPKSDVAQALLKVGDVGFGVGNDFVFLISTDADADVEKVVIADSYTLLAGETLIAQVRNSGSVAGDTETTLSLTLDFANRGIEGKSAYSGALASDTQAFNVHKVVAEFGIADPNSGGVVGVDYSAGDPNFVGGLGFYVKGITTTFDVNGNPIKFTVGEALKTQFTPFVFDNQVASFGDGFLATIDGSSLPGIGAFKPTLTVAYGSEDSVGGYSDVYNRGIRATISPATDVTLGLSAAQVGTDNNYDPDSYTNTVFGADLKAKIAGWNIQSEYATETEAETVGGTTTTDSRTIFYAHADGTVGPVSLRADGWSIDPDFFGVSYDAGGDHKVPFDDVIVRGSEGAHVEAKVTVAGFSVGGYFDRRSQYDNPAGYNLTGFGVNASGNISVVRLGAYFDSLTEVLGGSTNNVSRIGVTAGVNVAGFSVDGFYQSVTLNGTQVSKTPAIANAIAPWNAEQETRLGVNAKGNVGPVRIGASFEVDSGFVDNNRNAFGPADMDRTTIILDAAADFKTGIVTVSPEAHYGSVADADLNSDDTTTFKVGVKASTETLDAFLRPSFNASVMYTQTNHTDVGITTYPGYASGDNFTSTELSYSIGVKSEAFLFDKSTFALTWAGWQGKNRRYVPFSGTTAGQFADNPLAGDVTLGGIYGEWNYYDLNFAYGDFTLNEGGAVSNGQAFKISYKVKF